MMTPDDWEAARQFAELLRTGAEVIEQALERKNPYEVEEIILGTNQTAALMGLAWRHKIIAAQERAKNN